MSEWTTQFLRPNLRLGEVCWCPLMRVNKRLAAESDCGCKRSSAPTQLFLPTHQNQKG